MVGTITKEKRPHSREGNGSYFGGSGGDRPGSGGPGSSSNSHAGEIGLLFFLATVTMLFAGLTSALIIRRSSPDWQPLYFPHLLWLNTAMILLSSFTIERARVVLKQGLRNKYR